MPCGADWGGFSEGMDAMYEQGAFETESFYSGESEAEHEFHASRSATRGSVQADILADAIAGYK